jgi:hypothetical protein
MSLSTFWSNVRTLGLVTLVTVLIWIWADAETQKDDLLHAEPSRTASVEEAELTIEKLPVLISTCPGLAALRASTSAALSACVSCACTVAASAASRCVEKVMTSTSLVTSVVAEADSDIWLATGAGGSA